jgi:hypothetical protein
MNRKEEKHKSDLNLSIWFSSHEGPSRVMTIYHVTEMSVGTNTMGSFGEREEHNEIC